MHAVEQIAGEALPRKSSQAQRNKAQEEAVQGFSVDHNPKNLHPRDNADNPFGTDGAGQRPGNTIPGAGHDLSIMIGGNFIEIKDQIQMYTTNQLVSHPLVSPILQPSLGGLPPLLVLTGGGEILRDEQIYIAHKAANPAKYPPGEAYLDEYPEARDLIAKWKPTDVQLQVWDDLCHVAPTLSFTRPAKYMYRSIAQFGAWALARAQKTEIQIMDDDEVSVISSGSDSESHADLKKPTQTKTTMEKGVAQGGTATHDQVGRAGEPLPAFKNHMIRQRVDRYGYIYPLDPPSSLPALQISSNEVGVIKPGPVEKWLNAKKEWDTKYSREKRRVQKQRVKEIAQGYEGFGDDEVPPPSALAGRRGLSMPKEEKKSRSWGMSLWSLWGSSHDENTMAREEKADKEIEDATVTQSDGANAIPVGAKRANQPSRSRSRRRAVTYTGQADENFDENTSAEDLARRRREKSPIKATTSDSEHQSLPIVVSDHSNSNDSPTLQPLDPIRPAADGKAFPFKLHSHLVDDGRNASTVTLQSQAGVVTPQGNEKGRQLGESMENRTDEGRHALPVKNEVAGQFRRHAEIESEETVPKDIDATNPTEERRGTLEDPKGVLHHGPKAVAGDK